MAVSSISGNSFLQMPFYIRIIGRTKRALSKYGGITRPIILISEHILTTDMPQSSRILER